MLLATAETMPSSFACGGEYFGGMEQQRFQFHYRGGAAAIRRHLLGRGSMVTHNVIKRSQARAQLNWHNRVGLMRKVVVTGVAAKWRRWSKLLNIRHRRVQ